MFLLCNTSLLMFCVFASFPKLSSSARAKVSRGLVLWGRIALYQDLKCSDLFYVGNISDFTLDALAVDRLQHHDFCKRHGSCGDARAMTLVTKTIDSSTLHHLSCLSFLKVKMDSAFPLQSARMYSSMITLALPAKAKIQRSSQGKQEFTCPHSTGHENASVRLS